MRRDEPERLHEEFRVVSARLEDLADYAMDSEHERPGVASGVTLALNQPRAVADTNGQFKPGAVKQFVENSIEELEDAKHHARLTKTVRGIEQAQEQLRTLRDHEALQVVVETGDHQ